MRFCASGEFRRSGAVSRRDICSMLAKIALRINSLYSSDVRRINDVVRVVEGWRRAAALQYLSPFLLWEAPDFAGKVADDMRNGKENMRCGNASLVGWSDAALRDHLAEGNCRLGYATGLMSSSFTGPPHVLQRAPKFSRKLVEGSTGGEVYALSEMVDHWDR